MMVKQKSYTPVLTPEEKAFLEEIAAIPSFKYRDPDTGKIIFHAPAVPNNPTPSDNPISIESPVVVAQNGVSNSVKKGLVVLAIGLLGIGIIGLSILLIKEKNKNKKISEKLKEQKAKETRNKYYSLLNNYMVNAQEGSLSLSDVIGLAHFFEALIKSRRLGDITINLSKEEITVLYGIILKITKEICLKNNVLLESKFDEIDFNDDENGKFEAVLELLRIQEQSLSVTI